MSINCKKIVCQGTSLPKVLTYLKTMEEAKKDSNKDSVDIKIFTGKGNKCEKDVLGTRNCCTDSGWGKGVGLGSCSYEEQNLGLQKEKGMCVYVGSYCFLFIKVHVSIATNIHQY